MGMGCPALQLTLYDMSILLEVSALQVQNVIVGPGLQMIAY